MTEHPNIASAVVAALSDLTVVEKNRKANVGSYKYDYADLSDVVKLTRPILAGHGLVALTPLGAHADGLACTVTLLHTSGERLDFGPFPFPHGRDAQATGSMVTYMRRYSLLAALGMAAGDDDDGALAVAKEQAARSQAAAPPPDGPISTENVEKMVAKCADAGIAVSEVVLRATDGRTSDPAELLKSEIGEARKALDELKAVPA